MATSGLSVAWSWHGQRDALLAEAHARPSTPLSPPMLVTRIATISGLKGERDDRAHMTALCARLGQPEPGPTARWCVVDAGNWSLRWERHTEGSTWTFFRVPRRAEPFSETAMDLAPQDWVAGFPGQVLVAARLEVRPKSGRASPRSFFGPEAVGARLPDGGGSEAMTDFRPDSLGMTRFLLLDGAGDPVVTGRHVQALLEIETYRLLALMAFPVAGAAAAELGGIEERAAELAGALVEKSDIEADRALLDRLANLAGETEALIGRTSFRFGAAGAYHRLVGERIERLREERLNGMVTIGEFMQRRLEPAMRTCDAVERRERAAIDRIARMAQMLSTRVGVASEATSAALLRSMDRRAAVQIRLQQTVEGLSTVAIAYYAVGLLGFVLKGLETAWSGFDATVAAGIAAPLVVFGVWWSMRAMRVRLSRLADGHG
jgi:uncharacterized membrane-anchored protein